VEKVIIIAEAGVNHNGSMENAKKLVDVAVEAGVDYVKFQTFKTEKLVSKIAQKASYQKANTDDGDSSQYAMLKRLELSESMHHEIIAYCQLKGIRFLSTPFDEDSIALIKSLGVTIGKIPSGEITNLPYLRAMAEAFPELIISTGMCSIKEVEDAVDIVCKAGAARENITVLHCNTEYPTPMKDVNLKAMVTMAVDLGLKTGYSDHTLGIEVPIAAVALGATVIEKHFTLDKSMEGPDHKASLDPSELKAMVQAIRNIELAVSGSAIKEPSPSESKNLSIARKSIVAIKAIRKGDVFSKDNIGLKRPGNGISPMRWDEIQGIIAKKDFNEDELIEL
jgi:N,N'-diacetyllegionaminate synthase